MWSTALPICGNKNRNFAKCHQTPVVVACSWQSSFVMGVRQDSPQQHDDDDAIQKSRRRRERRL